LFFCVGASHHGAHLELLERLSLPAEALPEALVPFSERGPDGRRLCEGVILSTCNRTEIYAAPSVEHHGDGPPVLCGLPRRTVELLCRMAGLPAEALAARLVRREGWAAAEHLFRVVCGLDSLVVGERQVLGQAARAYAAAQAAGTAGVVLSTLFQEALRGGRRARARIGGAGAAPTIGHLAAARVERHVGSLAAARVVVIGTGEIGRLVLSALGARGARPAAVVSRSRERAEAACARWGGQARTFAELPALLGSCDALVSTTRASGPLVHRVMIEGAMARRPGRPLLLVDTSVPRAIDPSARDVPGVTLLDIDSFKEESAVGDRAEPRVAEDIAVFQVKLKELALRPLLGGLWRKAATIRGEVLERARARLPGLDEESWSAVEGLATSLVARLLHEPAVRLRAEAGNGHAAAYAEALRELFGVAE
jgi:glutamyl-tRNA reductase